MSILSKSTTKGKVSVMDEQREFWSGEFGDEYTTRNNSTELIGSNIALFSQAFKSISTPRFNS